MRAHPKGKGRGRKAREVRMELRGHIQREREEGGRHERYVWSYEGTSKGKGKREEGTRGTYGATRAHPKGRGRKAREVRMELRGHIQREREGGGRHERYVWSYEGTSKGKGKGEEGTRGTYGATRAHPKGKGRGRKAREVRMELRGHIQREREEGGRHERYVWSYEGTSKGKGKREEGTRGTYGATRAHPKGKGRGRKAREVRMELRGHIQREREGGGRHERYVWSYEGTSKGKGEEGTRGMYGATRAHPKGKGRGRKAREVRMELRGHIQREREGGGRHKRYVWIYEGTSKGKWEEGGRHERYVWSLWLSRAKLVVTVQVFRQLACHTCTAMIGWYN